MDWAADIELLLQLSQLQFAWPTSEDLDLIREVEMMVTVTDDQSNEARAGLDRNVRALLELTNEARETMTAILATKNVQESLEAMEEYLDFLLALSQTAEYLRKHKMAKSKGLDFDGPRFSWKGVVQPIGFSFQGIRGELLTSFIVYAVLLTMDGQNRMEKLVLDRESMDEQFIKATIDEIVDLFRKAAGYVSYIGKHHEWLSVNMNIKILTTNQPNIKEAVSYLFDPQACVDLAHVLLVKAQILLVVRARLNPRSMKDVKMSSTMIENAMYSALKFKVRTPLLLGNVFPENILRGLLGMFYLYKAAANQLEARPKQKQIYETLALHLLQKVTALERLKVLFQPLLDDTSSPISEREIRGWMHQLHNISLTPNIQRSSNFTEDGLQGLMGRCLLLDPIEFKRCSKNASHVTAAIHARAQRDKDQRLVRRKRSVCMTTSLKLRKSRSTILGNFSSKSSNQERLNEATMVDSWKYGLERIQSGHHRLVAAASHGTLKAESAKEEHTPKRCDVDENDLGRVSMTESQEHIAKMFKQDPGLPNVSEKPGNQPKASPTRGRRFTFVQGLNNVINIASEINGDQETKREVQQEVEPIIPRKTKPVANNKKNEGPSYIRYGLDGKPERIFMSPSKQVQATNHLVGELLRFKHPCALCQKEFTKDNLPGRVTRKRIYELQESWDTLRFNLGQSKSWKRRTKPAFLFTMEKVCLLCEHLCLPNLSKQGGFGFSHERNDDSALEKMILHSIKDVMEAEFSKLSASEREGILQNPTQTKPVPTEFLNMALSSFAYQSSTLDDDRKYSAFNATDDDTSTMLVSRTKIQETPHFSLTLNHVGSIHTIRLWTPETNLQASPVWFMVSRTPFSDNMSLMEAIQHAEVKRRFPFMSRIVEWRPRDEINNTEFRGRHIRIQLEKHGSLTISQCQVFAIPLIILPERQDVIIQESKQDVEVDRRAEVLHLDPSILQKLNTFRFTATIPELELSQYQDICHLLKRTQKKNENLSGNDEQLAIEKMLKRCHQAYENLTVSTKFQMELENQVKERIRIKVLQSDYLRTFQDQVKCSYRKEIGYAADRMEVSVDDIVSWQFEQLAQCFQEGLSKEMKRKDQGYDRVAIDTEKFCTYFRFNQPGFPFVANSVLLGEMDEKKQLHIVTNLLAGVPSIFKNGVDWVTFLLFLLFWNQLLHAKTEAITAEKPLRSPMPVEGKKMRPKSAHSRLRSKEEKAKIKLQRMQLGNSNSSSNRLRPASAAALRRETRVMIDSMHQRLELLCENEKKKHRVRNLLTPLTAKESRAMDLENVKKQAGLISKKQECDLCFKAFPVESLKTAVTHRAVQTMREEFQTKFDQHLEGKLVTPSLRNVSASYDQASVCKFCHQFFLAKYKPASQEKIERCLKEYEPMPVSVLYPHVQGNTKNKRRRGGLALVQQIQESEVLEQFLKKHMKAQLENASKTSTQRKKQQRRRQSANNVITTPTRAIRKGSIVDQAKVRALKREIDAIGLRSVEEKPTTDVMPTIIREKATPTVHPIRYSVREFAALINLDLELVARIVNTFYEQQKKDNKSAAAQSLFGTIHIAKHRNDQEELDFLKPKQSWRNLTKLEKIAHLAAVKLQVGARRLIQTKRAQFIRVHDNAVARSQRERKREHDSKAMLQYMEEHLEKTFEECETERTNTYKDYCKRYHAF